ncbi:extensin family protein [Oricola nitratireducens]|uniref:extensin-like domain-containing protein n=1 Tax=Oricola nitratireducens TaxID=2775868 RepID=UPI001FEDCF49|nr:extensin family protein [Oricola nitratireducens]
MTRKPLAAIAALFVCTTLVASCTVIDLAPIPNADVGSATPVTNVEMVSAAPAPGAMTAPAAPVEMASAASSPVLAPAPMTSPAPTPSPALAPTPSPSAQMTAAPPVTLGFPRVSLPRFGSRDGGMPAEEVQCRKRLKRLGVRFRDIPAIHDSASCGIDYPVEVSSLGRTIALKPAAKLNCAMAEEAARWVQSDLAPAARVRYFSGVAEIRQISSYSCRRIAGSRTMSEHSKGNALDIGAIKLKNGRVIDVHKPGLFAFRERSFLRRVRGEACDHFGTVLGPGYNRDHRDHFHIDLKQRRRTACH